MNNTFFILLLNIVYLFLNLSPAEATIPKSVFNKEEKEWQARWITHPKTNPHSYGVYHFRQTLSLNSLPDTLPIKISADNRYKLYVNGQLISMGPARGDLYNWRFEKTDIKPYLKKGKNIIAALVWNAGASKPVAQISHQTGLIFESGNPLFTQLNSGQGNWKVYKNEAYEQIPVNIGEYCVVGPTEKINAHQYPWGWKTENFRDIAWLKPKKMSTGKMRGFQYGGKWQLIPSSIPQLTYQKEPSPIIRKMTGLKKEKSKDSIKYPIKIPANSSAILLLDQQHLTIGYPPNDCF